MKICSKCKQKKQLDQFSKKLAGFSSHCKDCQRQYLKNHYKNNKEYYVKKAQTRKAAFVEFVNKIKSSTPCYDCKKVYPSYIMDFDHMGKQQKLYNISTLRTYGNMDKLKAEIAKCQVVCANCHRQRTYIRTLSSVE